MNGHGTSMRELLQQVQERTTVGPKVKLKLEDPSLTDPTATGDEPDLLKGLIKKPKKKDKGDGEIIINPTVESALRAQDREMGTDSLVRAYMQDTPGQGNAEVVTEDDEDDEGWYTHREIHGKQGISKEDWKEGWRLNSKGERVKVAKEDRDPRELERQARDYQMRQAMHQDARSMTRKEFAKKYRADAQAGEFHDDVRGEASKRKKTKAHKKEKSQTHNEGVQSVVSELSRQTLGRYMAKASDARGHRKLPTHKIDNRYAGVAKADKLINKDEKKAMDKARAYTEDVYEIKTPRGEKELPRQMKDPQREMMVFHPATGVKVIDRDKWDYHRKKGYHPAEEYEFDGDIINEEVFVELVERTAEDIVRGMKKNKSYFDKKYGDRSDAVMYATANKLANEHVAEFGIDEKSSWYKPWTWFDKDDKNKRPVSPGTRSRQDLHRPNARPGTDDQMRQDAQTMTRAEYRKKYGKNPDAKWTKRDKTGKIVTPQGDAAAKDAARRADAADTQGSGIPKNVPNPQLLDKPVPPKTGPGEDAKRSRQNIRKRLQIAKDRGVPPTKLNKTDPETAPTRTPRRSPGALGGPVKPPKDPQPHMGQHTDKMSGVDDKKAKQTSTGMSPGERQARTGSATGTPDPKTGGMRVSQTGPAANKAEYGRRPSDIGNTQPHMGQHTDKMSGVEPEAGKTKKDPKSHGDRLGVTLPPSPHKDASGKPISRLKHRQLQKQKKAKEPHITTRGTAVDQMLRDRNVDYVKDPKTGKTVEKIRDKHAANLKIGKSKKDAKTGPGSGSVDTQGTGIPKKITPPPTDAKKKPEYDWKHGKTDRMGNKLKYPHGYNQKTGKKLQKWEGGLRKIGGIEVDSRDSAYPAPIDDSYDGASGSGHPVNQDVYAAYISHQVQQSSFRSDPLGEVSGHIPHSPHLRQKGTRKPGDHVPGEKIGKGTWYGRRQNKSGTEKEARAIDKEMDDARAKRTQAWKDKVEKGGGKWITGEDYAPADKYAEFISKQIKHGIQKGHVK